MNQRRPRLQLCVNWLAYGVAWGCFKTWLMGIYKNAENTEFFEFACKVVV
jgi:hypothetical protein